jgi:hypothetical protein
VRHATGGLVRAGQYIFHQQAASFSTIPDPDLDELYSLKQEQQKQFVHPVSVTQLESMCRKPSLKLLVNSAAFLKSQLPARLQNHLQRLEVMTAASHDRPMAEPQETHLTLLAASTCILQQFNMTEHMIQCSMQGVPA